jgi:hypothetical protein
MRTIQRAAVMAAISFITAAAATAGTAVAAQAVTITGPGTSVTFSGTGGDYITQDLSWPLIRRTR